MSNLKERMNRGVSLWVLPLCIAPPVLAEDCLTFDETHKITLRGTIVQSATIEESEGVPPHKYMAIVLDQPVCWENGRNEKPDRISFMEVSSVSTKWLGHYVDATGIMTAGDSWGFSVKSIKDVRDASAQAEAGENVVSADFFEKPFSRDTIIRNGWNKMPDVAEYIKAKPGADKLGYGSECHLGSLVFAQCFLEPSTAFPKFESYQAALSSL